MIDERAWQDFHDGLDALARGESDPVLIERLAVLADGIPDGPLMLDLARRLADDRLDALAARAPAPLVDATWDRLEAALPDQTAARRPAPRRRGLRVLAGLAAAAGLALVFASGFLAGERRQLQARLDDVLARETRAAGAAAVSQPTVPGVAGGRTWTADELRRLLGRLPAGARLADAGELERLLLTGPPLRRVAARDLLDRYTTADGLTVAGAMRLLADLAPHGDVEFTLRDPGLVPPHRIVTY